MLLSAPQFNVETSANWVLVLVPRGVLDRRTCNVDLGRRVVFIDREDKGNWGCVDRMVG